MLLVVAHQLGAVYRRVQQAGHRYRNNGSAADCGTGDLYLLVIEYSYGVYYHRTYTEETYKNIVPSAKTGNAVTDIAISEFVDRFADNGITLKTSLKYPSNVAVNPFEMCVVLTNAIQNAYDASLRVNEPYAEITSVERENVYIISIKNKSDKKAQIDEEGIPISIKNDDGHGFGVRNIREISRKYNGDIEIKQFSENDGLWFVLNIMFVG